MGLKEFLYYAIFKRGKVLLFAIGFVVGVLVYIYLNRWGLGISGFQEASIKQCTEDIHCTYYCGQCVSITHPSLCEGWVDDGIERECICVDKECRLA